MVEKIAVGFRKLVFRASDQAVVFALIVDVCMLLAFGLFAFIG